MHPRPELERYSVLLAPRVAAGRSGEPCISAPVDSCGAGLACWYVDSDTYLGECVALCTGEPLEADCAPGTRCLQGDMGRWVVCLDTCDPRASTSECPQWLTCEPYSASCNPTAGCLPFDQRGGLFCFIEGQYNHLWDGASCTWSSDCAEPYLCAEAARVPGCSAETDGCCTPYCTLGASGQCGPERVCTELFAPGTAPDELDDLGVCLSPL